MDQFHSDSYKKKGLMQEFFGSCLGRLVILLFVLLFLYIFALITIPSKKMMLEETVDNIHECLQENDSIKADEIDEIINNISRTINVADTTLTNPELFKAFLKYNRLPSTSSTASIHRAAASASVSSRPSSPPSATRTWCCLPEQYAATITRSSLHP